MDTGLYEDVWMGNVMMRTFLLFYLGEECPDNGVRFQKLRSARRGADTAVFFIYRVYHEQRKYCIWWNAVRA